jgi:acetylornithine deacetylase/succinyl-diaminopimelate desuccinylase-like protein
MSTDETPLGLAKTAKANLDHRSTVSRLGKSIFRETDQDIIAMREASRALAGLIYLTEAPEPQGEPSDAQVRAAAVAMYEWTNTLSMSGATTLARAALRAAGGVR